MASLLESYYDLPPNVDGVPTLVRLSQNEHGRDLIFNILTYEVINTTGAIAILKGTKPDGNLYTVYGSISGLAVTITEDIQLTAVAGEWDAVITIGLSNDVLYTGLIHFCIEPDPMGTDRIPSESVISGIVERCEQAARQADEIKSYLDTYIEGLVYGDEVAY